MALQVLRVATVLLLTTLTLGVLWLLRRLHHQRPRSEAVPALRLTACLVTSGPGRFDTEIRLDPNCLSPAEASRLLNYIAWRLADTERPEVVAQTAWQAMRASRASGGTPGAV